MAVERFSTKLTWSAVEQFQMDIREGEYLQLTFDFKISRMVIKTTRNE